MVQHVFFGVDTKAVFLFADKLDEIFLYEQIALRVSEPVPLQRVPAGTACGDKMTDMQSSRFRRTDEVAEVFLVFGKIFPVIAVRSGRKEGIAAAKVLFGHNNGNIGLGEQVEGGKSDLR